MNYTEIKETLDLLGRSFAEFQSANDERLRLLEQSQRDGLLEAKVDRLNGVVEEASQKMQTLWRRQQRPLLGATLERDEENLRSPAAQAYGHFLRKGIADPLFQKALSSTTGEGGGYLIPTPHGTHIVSLMNETSPMRCLASVATIAGDTFELLISPKDGEVGWVQETAERPHTETSELMRLRIPVHEIYARPQVSQKLLDDSSVDIESWLGTRIAHRMGVVENTAFLKGDGEGKPKGLLTYPLTPLAQGEWGKFETLFSDDGRFRADTLFDFLHKVPSELLSGSSWLLSSSMLAEIRKVKNAQGTYLWQPGLGGAVSNTLLGYPVVLSEDMPQLREGFTGIGLVFGNFKSAYQIVDRAGLHILRDPYSAKPYVEFYATKRVGGDVINFQALRFLHLGPAPR